MNKEAFQSRFFFCLDLQRIGFGECIVTHSRDLPRDFHVRNTGANRKLMPRDLLADDGLRKLSDHSELVAEIGVEYFEPVRQRICCLPAAVGSDVPSVDVHHFRRLNRSMSQIFIGRVKRVIDPEVLGSGNDRTRDVDAALKIPGKATACDGIHAIARTEGIRSTLEKSSVAVSRSIAAWTSSAAEASYSITPVKSATSVTGNSSSAGVEYGRGVAASAEAVNPVTTVLTRTTRCREASRTDRGQGT